jgi:hypothetical protein
MTVPCRSGKDVRLGVLVLVRCGRVPSISKTCVLMSAARAEQPLPETSLVAGWLDRSMIHDSPANLSGSRNWTGTYSVVMPRSTRTPATTQVETNTAVNVRASLAVSPVSSCDSLSVQASTLSPGSSFPPGIASGCSRLATRRPTRTRPFTLRTTTPTPTRVSMCRALRNARGQGLVDGAAVQGES